MNVSRTIKTWSTPVVEEVRQCVPCALCGGLRFRPFLDCEGFSYVQCVSCALVQMNPQPLSDRVQMRYDNAYLEYELRNEAEFLRLQQYALADAGFERLERELWEWRGAAPRVLDIGCATGALLAVLRERGWHTTGVEISPAAAYARRERGLDVRPGRLEDCGFPARSFDLVLASHLIEHLNHPAACIREIGRILDHHGYCILTTPNIGGFQARLLGSRWRSAIFDHLYLFSKRTITALLAAQGFTTEGIYTWGGLAAGIAVAPIKAFADKAAKAGGLGDVMVVKARIGSGTS